MRQHALHQFKRNDRTGCRCGTDDYIRFDQRLLKFGEAAIDGAIAFGQLNGVLFRAIDNHQPLCAIITEVARCQFAHLAGANEQNTGLVESRKELAS